MSSSLKTYKEILFKGLRPWIKATTSEAKYKELYNELPKLNFKTNPKYEVQFDKATSNKRKYYRKLIENEAIGCINEIYEGVGKSLGNKHRLYLVYTFLSKTLKDVMSATNGVIEERELIEQNFKPLNGKIQKGNEADDAYIFQFLKHQLIRIYLEISEAYLEYSKTESLELDELYEIGFSEVAPESVIVPIDSLKGKKPKPAVVPEPVAQFNSFTYKKYDTDPDNLTNLWDSLKLRKLIDETTTQAQFKRVFSGREPLEPIKWTGNQSELYYFISQLYNQLQRLENLKQKQWEVAIKCFVKPDGSAFDKDKLRQSKKPASSYTMIDKILELV